jgi:deoxyribose-phosphate aldolase
MSLDRAVDFNSLKSFFFFASNPIVSRLCLPSGLLNSFPDAKSSVELCSLIDFPDGLQCLSARLADILYSVRSGAKYVDVPINNTLIVDKNFAKMRNEFKSCLEPCGLNNVKLRPILEYRLHEVDTIITVCENLLSIGISEVISATGRMGDEFSDDLLICKEIQDKVGMSVVFGGSCQTKKQYDNLVKAKIKGVRVISPKALQNIFGELGEDFKIK